MNIGHALKKLRTDRGFSQKEMCQNIVTVSYYSKVERGIHQISADHLFMILKKNYIPISNFLELIHFNDSKHKIISNQIEEAQYQLDFNYLKQLEDRLHHFVPTEDHNYERYNYLIKLVMYSITGDKTIITSKDKETLKQKIFDSHNWDPSSLALYNNMLNFYDLESNLLMINSIISKSDIVELEPFLVETILINFIINSIKNNYDEYVQPFFVIIDSISTKPNNFFNKNLILFLKNLIFYREKPADLFLENIQESLRVFDILGMSKFGIKMEQFYKKYKEISE